MNEITKQIGKILKDKRSIKNLSLEIINKDTRIPKAYLEAIEEGSLAIFSADVYYTGSLRKYALYLGLNANEIVEQYLNSKIETREAEAEKKHGEKINFYRILVVISFIIGIALLVFLFLLHKTAVPVVPSKKVAVEKKLELEKHPKYQDLELEIKWLSYTWVRVLIDGNLVFENSLKAGEKRTWIAKDKVVLRIGYVPGISATLNGKTLDLNTGAKDYINELELTKEFLTKDHKIK